MPYKPSQEELQEIIHQHTDLVEGCPMSLPDSLQITVRSYMAARNIPLGHWKKWHKAARRFIRNHTPEQAD